MATDNAKNIVGLCASILITNTDADAGVETSRTFQSAALFKIFIIHC